MPHPTLPAVSRLTKDLRLALRADQRTVSLARPHFPGPEPSATGGHCVTIAQLGSGVEIELWLDLYAGLPSPRAWVGFRSSSRSRIRRLVALAPSAGLHDAGIRRYTRDTHRRKGIWQFKNPLSTEEFDVQVLESYGSNFYLGLYMPYPWPLSRSSEHAIVRDSVNYIAALTSAYTSATSANRRAVGPWNRPDKAVEEAAIRYVKAKLHRSGYSVRSRQHEICGYDLHASRDGRELHVEVKGVSGDSPRFFISRTELKAAGDDADWRLAVVLHARTRPRMNSYIPGKRVRRLFQIEPIQWFATKRGLTT